MALAKDCVYVQKYLVLVGQYTPHTEVDEQIYIL